MECGGKSRPRSVSETRHRFGSALSHPEIVGNSIPISMALTPHLLRIEKCKLKTESFKLRLPCLWLGSPAAFSMHLHFAFCISQFAVIIAVLMRHRCHSPKDATGRAAHRPRQTRVGPQQQLLLTCQSAAKPLRRFGKLINTDWQVNTN